MKQKEYILIGIAVISIIGIAAFTMGWFQDTESTWVKNIGYTSQYNHPQDITLTSSGIVCSPQPTFYTVYTNELIPDKIRVSTDFGATYTEIERDVNHHDILKSEIASDSYNVEYIYDEVWTDTFETWYADYSGYIIPGSWGYDAVLYKQSDSGSNYGYIRVYTISAGQRVLRECGYYQDGDFELCPHIG